MIKRPLLGMAISFIFGILLYELPIWLLGLGSIFLFLVLYINGRTAILPIKFTKEDRHRYLWPVFLLVGVISMNQAVQPNEVEANLTAQVKGTAEGRIVDMKETQSGGSLLLSGLKVTDSQELVFQGDYAVVYISDLSKLSIGNIIKVSGDLLPLSHATNPGQFDEASYYKAKDVDCKIYAEELTVIDDSTSFPNQQIYQVKKRLTAQMSSLLPPKEAGLMNALLFGDKALLADEINQLYRENGFSHIMAVSGLHISLLGYGLYRLLKKLTAPVPACCIIPSLLLVLYGMLTGFSVSTKRAVVMFLLMMTAKLIGRTYDMLSALALSAILVLAAQPLQIYQSGFLFSYAAILGILLLAPLMNDSMSLKGSTAELNKSDSIWTLTESNAARQEDFVSAVLQKKHSQLRKLKMAFISSFSIQVFTIPLTCYFYYEIPLYGILTNLILLPFCSVLVFTALVACLISFISLAAGQFVIGLAYFILQLFSKILKLFNRLPYHLILIGKPELFQIILYFLFLILIMLVIRTYKKVYLWCLLFILPLFLHVVSETKLSINVLDVGQGDGIVMCCEGSVIMLDGGSTDVKEVYEYRIKPFLKSKGIPVISCIIVSHTDMDHISGIIELLTNMQPSNSPIRDYNGELTVNQIILPDIYDMDEAYKSLAALAESKSIAITYMKEGSRFTVKNLFFTCLHPSKETQYNDKNSNSLVLLASYGHFKALFTGDISADAERNIAHKYSELFSENALDVLKAAHHGSKYSSSLEFLECIHPKLACISAGINNRFGHPHEETLQRFHVIGANTMVTAKGGAIKIWTDGERIVVKRGE